MQATRTAITVARTGDGWSWTLTGSDGVPAAAGVAAEQHLAMEIAWRAARSLPDRAGTGFPEIIVEQHVAVRRARVLQPA